MIKIKDLMNKISIIKQLAGALRENGDVYDCEAAAYLEEYAKVLENIKVNIMEG